MYSATPMRRVAGSSSRLRGGGTWILAVCALVCFGCGGCTEDRAPGAGVTTAERVKGSTPLALPVGKCSAGLVAPAGHASIIEIPSLGGTEVFVQDVNEAGVVVGSERAKDGRFHAFRYTDAGGLQDLGATGTAYAS